MSVLRETHVYLAGPDVFFPDAIGIGERKKAFLATLGLIGHFPFDNEIAAAPEDETRATAHKIAAANEHMMLACCDADKIGMILINMTPFRAPMMDTGTAFEAGFMAALSYIRPDVVLIGYSPDPRCAEDRLVEDLYGGRVEKRDGRLFTPDGFALETFGCPENLMVTGAIERTGGHIFKTFEEAAFFAKEISDARNASFLRA